MFNTQGSLRPGETRRDTGIRTAPSRWTANQHTTAVPAFAAIGIVAGIALCRALGPFSSLVLVLLTVLTAAALLSLVALLWGTAPSKLHLSQRTTRWVCGAAILFGLGLGNVRANLYISQLTRSPLIAPLFTSGRYTADLRGFVAAEPVFFSDRVVHIPLRATAFRMRGSPWRELPPEPIRVVLIARSNEKRPIPDALPLLSSPEVVGDLLEFRGLRIQPQRGFAPERRFPFWEPPAALGHWTATQVLQPRPGPFYLRWPIRARRRLLDSLRDTLTDLPYRIAAATTLGHRYPLYQVTFHGLPMKELFARAGISHLQAISGLHVSIIAGGLLFLLPRLRVPHFVVALLAVSTIGFYVLMAGAPACTIRAGIMTSLSVLGWSLRSLRPPTGVILGLSIAAAAILLFQPGQLFDVGFQISFLSVLSLVAMAPWADAVLRRVGWARPAAIRRLVAAQIALLLGVLGPLSPYYFERFSVAGLAVNLFAIPLSAVLLPCALGAALLGLLPGPAAYLSRLVSYPIGWMYHALAYVAWLGAISLPYLAPPRPSLLTLFLYYSGLVGLLVWVWCGPARRILPTGRPATVTREGPPHDAGR